MHKLLRFYLFHHNIRIVFFFVFYRMYQTFYLSFSDREHFYAVEILGNESFRIEIVSLFSTCQMFNYSVTVLELANFLWSFYFSSFTSKVQTCSTPCNFPVSFFIMFHVVFVIIFCYNSLWAICIHYAHSTLQHHIDLLWDFTKAARVFLTVSSFSTCLLYVLCLVYKLLFNFFPWPFQLLSVTEASGNVHLNLCRHFL